MSTIHVIYRRNSIEDHYDAPCAVALTPEGAQTWITNTVARANRVRTAGEVCRAAVKAWAEENPNPFTEPPPPALTKWPNGVGKKDPRYSAYRSQRDAELRVIDAWALRKREVEAEYHARESAVYLGAAVAGGYTEEEARDSRGLTFAEDTDEGAFFVEAWETVD